MEQVMLIFMNRGRSLLFVLFMLTAGHVSAQYEYFPIVGQNLLQERQQPVEPNFGPGQLTASNFEATAADFELGACYVMYNVGAQGYFGEGNAWGTQASISANTPLMVRFTVPEGMALEDNALLFHDFPNTKNAWNLVFIDRIDQIYVDRGPQPNYFWQVMSSGDKTYRLQASPLNPDYNPASYPGYVGLDVTADPSNTALLPFLEEGEGHYLDWQFFPVPAWTQYFREKDIYDKAQELKAQIEEAEAAGVDVTAAAAVYNDLAATVEQLQQAIDDLRTALWNALVANMVATGSADHPSDGTPLIKNPNFDNASSQGWVGTAPNMVGAGGHGPADVAEHYNKTFDTYQDIQGLPDGVYALRANTAFRGSLEDMLQGIDPPAVLYAGTSDEEILTSPFINMWSIRNTEPMAGATPWRTEATEQSRLDENGKTIYIPDDPSAARLYFQKGYYQNVLFFEVADKPAVRIGVRCDKLLEGIYNNWAVFDTFTLTYYGNSEESYQKWVELGQPTLYLSDDAFYTTAYLDAYHEAQAAKATNKTEALQALELIRQCRGALLANISAWRHYSKTCQQLAGLLNYCKGNPKEYPDSFWQMRDIQAAKSYIENDYPKYISARELTNEQLDEECMKVDELLRLFEWAIAVIVSSIEEMQESPAKPSALFDLQGRRLNGVPQRGMYIRDGRKYVVK